MTATVQELLTPEQAAQRIGVHRSWVLRRIATKELPAINWSGAEGRGARWRIDPAALDVWLRERHRAA